MPSKRDYTTHPYRLSDSTFDTLHACERRFQLDRMLINATVQAATSRGTPETVRGTAYGAGVQSYLIHGNMDRAIYDCWLAYTPMLEDPPKTFLSRTLNNLKQSQPVLDGIRKLYRIATFHDEPAVELSFRLNITENKWYYVGYIDAVLQEIATGVYVVFECKTTAAHYRDLTPLYRYSGQALGYSIILDQIAGQDLGSFATDYLVCRDLKAPNFVPEVQLMHFKWTLLDRLKWFFTLQMDVDKLEVMHTTELFPLRKNGCLRYGKVCPHFGFCHMLGGDTPRPIPQDKNEYSFTYNLEEVIANHVARIG